MRSLLHRFDTSLTGFVTSWPAGLEAFFVVVTTLGLPAVTLTIGGVVALFGVVQTNLRLAFSGLLVWLTLGIGTGIKLLTDRERPLTEYAAPLQSHSFPSGHTTGSTIAYGLLAYLAWQLLPQPWNYIVTILLVAIILLIGISRVYLGAHFPSDVVAGWLLGSIALCIIIFIIKPLA